MIKDHEMKTDGNKYVRYVKECPFCKSKVENYLTCNLFCNCGAKYYYNQGLWLERKSGRKVFEHGQELDEFLKSINAPPLMKWQRDLLLNMINTPYRAQFSVYWRMHGYDKLVQLVEDFDIFMKDKRIEGFENFIKGKQNDQT